MAVGGALDALRSVVRRPELRSVELSWALGIAGDGVLLIVGLIAAYDAAGAFGLGILGLVRLLPATLVNLVVDPGGRRRPGRLLVVLGVLRALAAAGVALAVVAGEPAAAFVAIGLAAAAGALVRPATLGMLPALAVTPGELVAGNVAVSLGEGLGTFAGPLLGALVVARAGTGPTALLAATLFALSALAVVALRIAPAGRPPVHERAGRSPVATGIRALAARPPAGVVLASFLAQVTVRGVLTTLTVLLAIEVLDLGEPGVGVLGAALGLGGIAGGLGAFALAGRRTLAPVFAIALAGWGLPIAVAGAWTAAPVAVAALAVVGLANALLDVSGFTLLQRGIPNRARSGVFAVLEAGAGIGQSIGGLIAPPLVAALGTEGALMAAGLVLPLAALAGWPLVRRLDHEGVVPEGRAALLRGIPLFGLLPLAGLEQVAAGMVPCRFAAGERLMTEGEPGDRYLVLASGTVAVSTAGRERRRQGPGEGLGEIALLRAVPRTATVTALEPVEAFAIDRDTFLEAVLGHAGARAAAEAVVAGRLAPSPDA